MNYDYKAEAKASRADKMRHYADGGPIEKEGSVAGKPPLRPGQQMALDTMKMFRRLDGREADADKSGK